MMVQEVVVEVVAVGEGSMFKALVWARLGSTVGARLGSTVRARLVFTVGAREWAIKVFQSELLLWEQEQLIEKLQLSFHLQKLQ